MMTRRALFRELAGLASGGALLAWMGLRETKRPRMVHFYRRQLFDGPMVIAEVDGADEWLWIIAPWRFYPKGPRNAVKKFAREEIEILKTDATYSHSVPFTSENSFIDMQV